MSPPGDLHVPQLSSQSCAEVNLACQSISFQAHYLGKDPSCTRFRGQIKSLISQDLLDMPLSVLLFYTRRPDITPSQFQRYMEDIHVPLIKEVMGLHFPQIYSMRYVVRVESGAGDRLGAPIASRNRAHADTPVVLVGSPDDLGWDAMGEMIFRDEYVLPR